MADKTAIEWTDATWNPIVGCSVVSPGCTNCYAMKMAARLERMGSPIYRGRTTQTKAGAVWNGTVDLSNWGKVIEPMGWKRPRRIFVNSMSDLFHDAVTDDMLDLVFAVMALCPQHTFQVLTKRSANMRRYVNDTSIPRQLARRAKMHEIRRTNTEVPHQWPLPNVWLGVSVENQKAADERIPDLLETSASIRFLSCEPLLGMIDLRHVAESETGYINALSSSTGPNIDWVIAGGESGPNARPWSIRWARALVDECNRAHTAFFWKQNGEWRPARSQPSETPGNFAFGDYDFDPDRMMETDRYPRQFTALGAYSIMERIGKKKAGALLDGKPHREFPNLENH